MVHRSVDRMLDDRRAPVASERFYRPRDLTTECAQGVRGSLRRRLARGTVATLLLALVGLAGYSTLNRQNQPKYSHCTARVTAL
jgi:hypothetical protein